MKGFRGEKGVGDLEEPDRDRAPPARRLSDRKTVASSSAEELVINLLRAQRPYTMPLGRRQRLSIALAGVNRRRGRTPAFAALALAFAIVVCGGAFASARLLHWPRWLADRFAPPAAPPLSSTAATTRPRERSAPASPTITSPTTGSPVDPAPVAPAAALPIPPRASATARVPATPSRAFRAVRPPAAPNRPTAPLAKPGNAATPEEDTALALAALRALRRGHDPVHARALLDAYILAHPDGPLAEEALAISIEAAVAHHDPDARALALRYLRLYPNGSFRALARQSVGPSAAGP